MRRPPSGAATLRERADAPGEAGCPQLLRHRAQRSWQVGPRGSPGAAARRTRRGARAVCDLRSGAFRAELAQPFLRCWGDVSASRRAAPRRREACAALSLPVTVPKSRRFPSGRFRRGRGGSPGVVPLTSRHRTRSGPTCGASGTRPGGLRGPGRCHHARGSATEAVRRTGRARRRRPPGEVAVCQMTPPRHSTKRAFARSAGSCRRLSFRGPTERAASAPKGGDARARPAPARGRAPGPWRSGGPQVSAAPGARPAAQCHARFARRRATLGFLHVAFLTDTEGLGVQGPAAGAPCPLR